VATEKLANKIDKAPLKVRELLESYDAEEAARKRVNDQPAGAGWASRPLLPTDFQQPTHRPPARCSPQPGPARQTAMAHRSPQPVPAAAAMAGVPAAASREEIARGHPAVAAAEAKLRHAEDKVATNAIDRPPVQPNAQPVPATRITAAAAPAASAAATGAPAAAAEEAEAAAAAATAAAAAAPAAREPLVPDGAASPLPIVPHPSAAPAAAPAAASPVQQQPKPSAAAAAAAAPAPAKSATGPRAGAAGNSRLPATAAKQRNRSLPGGDCD